MQVLESGGEETKWYSGLTNISVPARGGKRGIPASYPSGSFAHLD